MLKRLVKGGLALLPRQTVLPILSGPARGLWWMPNAFNKSAWTGRYEASVVDACRAVLREGMVVYDLGAAAGVYTLIFSRLVGPAGRVISVECSRDQLHSLRRHVTLNRLDNVSVVEACVWSSETTIRFAAESQNPGGIGGFVFAQGERELSATTLDRLSEVYGAPDFVKIDVECAEADVLEGASRLLEDRRPKLCLACHGGVFFERCRRLLEPLGYRPRLLEGTPEKGTSLWDAGIRGRS